MRFIGTYPSWLSLTNKFEITAFPNIGHNDNFFVDIEVFDGCLTSTPCQVKIVVLHDPPVATESLVDKMIRVGKTLKYKTPAKNNLRKHDAIV